jgi:hypothetical protein
VPEQHYQEDSSPIVRVEVVDHLPQGRRVARFEAEHETVIAAVDPGKDFEGFLHELEGVLQEAVESQTWKRQPPHPPQEDPPHGD